MLDLFTEQLARARIATADTPCDSFSCQMGVCRECGEGDSLSFSVEQDEVMGSCALDRLVVKRLAVPAVVALTVTLLASACGAIPTSVVGVRGQATSGASTPTTAASSTSIDPALSADNPGGTVDVSGLHIEGGISCERWVVLAGQAQTLDVGTVQQITQFLKSGTGFEQSGMAYFGDPSHAAPPPPIAVVSGSTDDDYAQRYIPGLHFQTGCFGELQITNTGQQTVAVSAIHAAFTSASAANGYAYRLIDYCSLVKCITCQSTPVCGTSVNCQYFASLNLHPGPAGTQLEAPIQSQLPQEGQCPVPLVFHPGDFYPIDILVDSQAPSQIYHLQLSLTLDTGAGPQTLTLPSSFNSAIVFAASSQFTCYGLQGTTFVQEPQVNADTCI